MKLFLSVDMEGITGLPDPSFVSESKNNYERSRRIMTQEANAIIESAFQHGAKDILVNDSHSSMNNLLVEELHPEASLITGGRKPFSMVQSLDSSYDAAVFAGYHSRAGQPGVMSHTMTLYIRNIFLNDVQIGEIGMNAYMAGYYNVPVIMLAGDDCACREIEELIPGVTTATVKEAISRSAAKTMHPEKAKLLLKDKVAEAIQNMENVKPLTPPEKPILKVEFNNYGQAESAAIMPGCEVEKNSTIVRYEAKNMAETYRALMVMLSLASGVSYS